MMKYCTLCGSLSVALLFVTVSAPGSASGLGGDKNFGNNKQFDIPQWALDANKTATPSSDFIKDASTVVLYHEYVETVDEQGQATERERFAFRILKPQGRREGCYVGYDVDEKIHYFHAWTITADGKQFQAKDVDFSEYGETDNPIMLATYKARVARPPAMDIGATVICDSETLLAPYHREKIWHIQENSPTVFEALELDLPPGHAHAQTWHNYKPVAPIEVAPNHWRWEIKNMPLLTLRDIPSSPEWSSLAARMYAHWGDSAVEGTDNEWRAIGQWFTKLEASRPDPSPEITQQTQNLIAGAPDFYAKLSKISEYIQKNLRYFIVERGIGGYQANKAADIFRNHYGDCKDKTTLLISMLQVAGIHSAYLAVDTNRGAVDPFAPSIYGNHMITAIEVPADINDPRLLAIAAAKNGKRYLIFDPTNEQTPIGNLPAYLQGGYGLLAEGSSSQVLIIPTLAPEASTVERKGSFTLSADGSLTGSVDTSYSGWSGAEIRARLKFRDEKKQRESLESSIAHDIPGVILDSYEYVQPPALDQPIALHYKVTTSQYARSAGSLLLVRPRVVGNFSATFNEKPRTVPFDLDATGRWKDSYDITLPAGYAVDEAPDPVTLDMDFASYHSSVTAKGNLLHYEREYIVRQVELPADRASDFRKMQTTILANEKGTAVLKKQ